MCHRADRTQPALARGAEAWRSISHLSLNYLSLKDAEDGQGANALREMLRLYIDAADRPAQKQVEGVLSTTVEPIICRLESQDGSPSFVEWRLAPSFTTLLRRRGRLRIWCCSRRVFSPICLD